MGNLYGGRCEIEGPGTIERCTYLVVEAARNKGPEEAVRAVVLSSGNLHLSPIYTVHSVCITNQPIIL